MTSLILSKVVSLMTSVTASLVMVSSPAAPGTWVRSNYALLDVPVTHYVGLGIVNYGSTSGMAPGQSGVDDSTDPHRYPRSLTGSTNGDAPWDVEFLGITELGYPGLNNVTYEQLPWSSPSQSLGAHKALHIETYWENIYGWEVFDYQVNGSNTGTSVRRDLDQWDPQDFATIISDAPGGGGGSE